MKFKKFAFVIAFVLTAVLFAEVALHADEAGQSTSSCIPSKKNYK